MLMVDENHRGVSRSAHSAIQMLYTKGDRPRGHAERSGSTCNGGGRHEQKKRHRGSAGNSGPSTSRGNHGGVGEWFLVCIFVIL